MSYLTDVLKHDSGRDFWRLEDESKWHSYGETFRLAERDAGWLKGLGVERGSRVAIQLDTSRDLVRAHTACWVLGAIRVPFHYKETYEEIKYRVGLTQPTIAIGCNPANFPGIPTFSEMKSGKPVTDWAVDQEITSWLFTSGSTGAPKGVQRSYAALENCSNALTKQWGLTPDDVLYSGLPFHHAHMLDIAFAGVAHRGARFVIARRFRPIAPPREATMFFGIPTNWQLLMDEGTPAAWEGYGRLAFAVSGSAYLDPKLALAVKQATGLELANRLARTEELCLAAHLRYGERRPNTVGFPLDWVELKLDPEDGEILVRCNPLFPGYFPPVEPRVALGEWYGTGDTGQLDDVGQIIYLGRKDDIIKRGAEKIGPDEIEYVLLGVEGVKKACCFPVPHRLYGEAVGAAIVVDDGFKADSVKAACESAVKATLGQPKWLEFLEVLEESQWRETALGKTKRKEIRKIYFS